MDSGRCGPAMAVPWRCHGRLSRPPSFPATTIQLKNHLSLAVRLGMGDYKQLWKRLTGDRCLTALWPSRHYWGPFSWLSSSVDRHTVVVTGNWEGGGRGTVADLGSAGIRQGIMGNGTIYARRQFVPNLTSLNDSTKSCEVDVGPSQRVQIFPNVVIKLSRVAGIQVLRPTESRDLWSLSHRGGDQLGLATGVHAKSSIWMQHMAEPGCSMEGMKGSFTP